MIIKGKAHKFGNDVNTDDIIAAKYLVTTNIPELGKHCMEHLRPEFSKNVQKGDIIVAGKYFGCGSSREHAPMAILGCGVSAVIARNFASIFYRNSINIGLPILECACADEIDEQDALEIDLSNGVIKNITKNKTYRVQPFPAFLQNIITSGGLIAYVSKKQE